MAFGGESSGVLMREVRERSEEGNFFMKKG